MKIVVTTSGSIKCCVLLTYPVLYVYGGMLKGAWLYLFYHVIIYSFWFTCTIMKWWVLFETKNKTLIFVPKLVALFSKQLYFTLTEQLQTVEESTATIKEPCRKM